MKEGFAVLIGYQPCYVSFHRSNFRCIHAHGTQHLLTHIVDGKPPIMGRLLKEGKIRITDKTIERV